MNKGTTRGFPKHKMEGILKDFEEWLATIDGGPRKADQVVQTVVDVAKFLYFCQPEHIDADASLEASMINSYLRALEEANLRPAGIASKILRVRTFVDFFRIQVNIKQQVQENRWKVKKLKIYYNRFSKLKHADAKLKKSGVEEIVENIDLIACMTSSKLLIKTFNEYIDHTKEKPPTDTEYTYMRRFVMMQLLFKLVLYSFS